MEPISLILAALAAGASRGLTDAASNVIKDAYDALKSRVMLKVREQPGGEVSVLEHEKDSDTWSAPLAKALSQAGADQDVDVIAAAQRLMELIDPDGAKVGGYTVNVTATGDRSIAANTISGGAHTGDSHS